VREELHRFDTRKAPGLTEDIEAVLMRAEEGTIERDEDLESLYRDPRFIALVARAKNRLFSPVSDSLDEHRRCIGDLIKHLSD